MQVSVETTSGLERKMTVEVPADAVNSAVNERLQKLAKTSRLNGFRPGKVPFKVVKKRYEPQVRGEVLGDLINSSFHDAVAQEKLRLAGQPAIEAAAKEEDTIDDGQFKYTAVFEVYPDFEPKFDAEIGITQPVVNIAEIEIDEMLESLREQRIEYVDVDRVATTDDQIVIDFSGSIDGVEFEGGKAEKAPLVLGSGTMIDGFESQLIGASAGDFKTITVDFPENYGSDELAGKKADFAITVHSVQEAKLPEMDEELIKSFGIEDGTLDGFRADIRNNMERELNQRIEARIKQQVMDGLLELNKVDIPNALTLQEVGRLREKLAQQMPPQKNEEGGESDAVSQLPDEMFMEEATRRVRLGLVIGEIVRHNNLKPDAAAVREQINLIASTYQEPQAVVDYYYGNQELMQNVEGLVLEDAVTKSVIEKATVTEQSMSYQEIMNPEPSNSEQESTEEIEG